MGKIVLLAVAAAWAAVLIPPLIRSRVENRPNSSVTDFRRQLSTLQRTVPTRGIAPMRTIGRPLTQAPRQRVVPPGRRVPRDAGGLRRDEERRDDVRVRHLVLLADGLLLQAGAAA